jgi:ADP-heptose:LPS heptosyltransferase
MLSLEHLSRLIFRASSPFLDWTLKKLSSSQRIHSLLKAREDKHFRKINGLKRILIVAGINIGDALMAQPFIAPLKNSNPETEISYLYQRRGYPLIMANPSIDRHFPLIKSIGYPSKGDFKSLKSVIEEYNFDLIFNFCPYFSSKDFKPARTVVIYPTRLIANVIDAYASKKSRAQILFQMNRFANECINNITPGAQDEVGDCSDFSSHDIYVSGERMMRAERIMERLKINPRSKKILFNPDTSCSYTRIPFEFQVELIKGILSADKITLLLSSGFSFPNIERELLKAVSPSLTKKIAVIPKDTPIDVFASLIDHSHMFITGDTAPLHIAAARRVTVDSDNYFRNATAVVGIFGATSGKIYGYDSYSDAYLPSAQDAPSKIFEANPECKNLTCIDKIFKACPEVRCFDGLEPEPIIDYIRNYLSWDLNPCIRVHEASF